jgi:hypothetical protein
LATGKHGEGEKKSGCGEASLIKRQVDEDLHREIFSVAAAAGISSTFPKNATKRAKSATNWSCNPSTKLLADSQGPIR